eukprot:9180059-Pyramimonas_sp.AAC.2
MESSNVMDALNMLAKYPPLKDPAYPKEDDGIVHMEVVRYMLLLAGVDLNCPEPAKEGLVLVETIVGDPKLARSIINVARSPLGWTAIDKVRATMMY